MISYKVHRRATVASVLAAFALPAVAVDSGTAPQSQASPALSTVIVTADSAGQETAATPVEGYVATRSTAGTKTDTPLMETPQTINVITQQQIVDQGGQSVNEALRYAPGVSSYGSSTRSDWYTAIRGFTPAVYLDGLALPTTMNLASWVMDPYQLERIEILRGPASVLYGQGDPGATVNMISKLPTDTPQREIEWQYGSHDRKQLALDFAGPLNQDGSLLYRLIMLDKSASLVTGPKKDRRTLIAPSMTWRPSDHTSLTVSLDYLHDNTEVSDNFLPAQGTVLPNPNGKISPTLFTGDPNFDHYKKTEWSVGYALEHQLDSVWTVRQKLRYMHLALNNNAVYGIGLDPTDPSDSTMSRTAGIFNPSYNRFTVDTQGQARFSAGQTSHTVLLGIDFQRQNMHDPEWSGQAPGLNMFNPVYQPINLSTFTQDQDTWQRLRQIGVYLQDQVKFDRHWVLVVGGRQDSTSMHSEDQILKRNRDQNDSHFTYRTGLVYLADNGLAPWVSYSTSYNPQLGTLQDGTPFKPTTGKQIEAGIRYQPAGAKSTFSAAVYQITQNNVLTPDPSSPANYSVQTGQVRSRGIELNAVASLNRNVSLTASYMIQDVKNTQANPANNVDSQGLWPTAIPLPRQMASLWGDYTVHGGMWDRFGMGAGIRYTGKAAGSMMAGDNSLEMPAYTLLDAAIHYRIGPWRLALNANNLTNKTYVTGCQYAGACFYGTPRNLAMTAAYAW